MLRRTVHPWFWGGFTAVWLLDAAFNAMGCKWFLAPGESWTACSLTAVYDSSGWALICAAGWFLAWRTPLDGPSRTQRLLRVAGVAVLLVVARIAVIDGLSRVAGLPGLPPRPAVVLILHSHLLTALPAIGVGYAFAYYFRYREQTAAVSRAQAQLARAELAALQAQLNPHFLFNALNSVAALMYADAAAAQRVLARLGQLLRVALDRSGRAMVPLAEELDFVAAYLEIEQARMGGRLSVAMDVQPAARAFPVPHMVLQPLVENAVKHGLAARRGPGRVEVRAALADGRLRLEVRDDGVGLPHGWDGRRVGVGVGNTRTRLEQLYGPAHRFRLEPRPEGGVAARMELPPAVSAAPPAAPAAAEARRADARTVEREVLPWAFSFWATYMVFATATFLLSAALGGRTVTVIGVLRNPVFNSAFWLVISLVLLRVAGRFPFTRGRKATALGVHAAAVAGLVLAFAGARALLIGVPFTRIAVLAFAPSAVIACNMLGIAHALHYYVASREREVAAAELEARRTRAELAELQAQMRPRFLFDALESVAALVRSDLAAAERVLARLGDLLRLALGRPAADRVPLGDELDFAAAYLEVERARLGGRLAVEMEIDPAARAVPVPHRLLQPLVEEAARTPPAPGGERTCVAVRASTRDGWLRLEVAHDGASSPATEAGEEEALRARLAAAYGDAQRVERTADGARTIIEIPLPAESEG